MAKTLLVLLFMFSCVSTSVLAQDPVTELLLRVERVESDNRALRGKIDELEFKNRTLEERLKKFSEDAEFRFQDLERKKSSQSSAPQVGAVQNSNDLKKDALKGTQPQSIESLIKNDGGHTEKKDTFESAMADFKGQNFAAAESGFDRAAKENKGAKSAEALYWRGESQLKLKKHQQAATTFLEIKEKHSKSTVGPQSMLKLAEALHGMGEKEAACSTYKSFEGEYPKATDSLKNKAKSEISNKKCR